MNRVVVCLLLSLCLIANAEAGRKKKKKDVAREEIVELVQPTIAHQDGFEGVGELIYLPCDWVEGLEFRYSMTTQRFDAREVSDEPFTTRSPTSVSIVKTGIPQTIRYLATDPVFSGPEQAVATAQKMFGDLPDLPMDVVLDAGSVAGLANFSELLGGVEAMVDQMTVGVAPDAKERMLQMFRDPVTGPAILLKEPSQFFALHCVGLREDQRIEAAMQFPNPFGGAPFPGISVVSYASHDVDAGTITIDTEDYVDPEALKPVILDVMAKMVPPDANEAEVAAALAQLPPVESRTEGRFVMSTVDGFPVQISITQVIGSAEHPARRKTISTWVRSE